MKPQTTEELCAVHKALDQEINDCYVNGRLKFGRDPSDVQVKKNKKLATRLELHRRAERVDVRALAYAKERRWEIKTLADCEVNIAAQ